MPDDAQPSSPPRMFMRWLSLLFLHWPVPAEALRPLVPAELEIDTFDGRAWVGLVPFSMQSVRHTWWIGRRELPFPGLPGATNFHECNVRTYVRFRSHQAGNEELPGVWFFSLDASSRLAVWGARTFWNLPYFNSRIALDRQGDEVDYRVDRRDRRNAIDEAYLRCRWRAGTPLPGAARPGELPHFLTERYSLFSQGRDGRIRRGRIAHVPWPLREAEILELDDTLVKAGGIEIDMDLGRNPPLAWHADRLDVRAWALEESES